MTIDWTSGKNKQYLRQALVDIYRSPKKLTMFVSDELSRNLNTISTEAGLEERAFDLVEAADSAGWIDELYARLCQQNPTNSRLYQLQEELQDTSSALTIVGAVANQAVEEQVVPGEAGTGPVVMRDAPETALREPENSAHLVVTVFWKGEKKLKQFRLSPKLCYRHPQGTEIVHKLLFEEDDIDAKPISRSRFPEALKGLHTFALATLRREVVDRPWKLSIALFLPLDLLCLPLSTWCGVDGNLQGLHAVVLGCSDRFDPNRPHDALNFYNQLELQWERFFNQVPDVVGSNLTRLDWLESTRAATSSLTSYAGFQCLGGWLVPGEWDALEEPLRQKWKDLVRFGVPLALWMCQGNVSAVDRRRIFDALIQGTRFDLLDRIPAERNIQQRAGQCVGVLYEDLHYTPERPKLPEPHLFRMPGY